MKTCEQPMPVMERARLYVQRCPPAVSGQHGHDATFRVACALVQGFALSAAHALTLLREWNSQCQPPWTEGELRHKVVSAFAATATKPRGYLRDGPRVSGSSASGLGPTLPPPLKRKAEFQAETLRRVAARAPQVNEEFVKSRSPLCPETQTPASFLHRLYRPGECVVVFDRMESQGVILKISEPPYDAGCLEHWVNGCPDGVWFLCNPVDGLTHANPRLGGKPSCRSEESVVAWRYLVLESDKADPRDWLAVLAQMPLRIAAIYTSGGRSIHALVRVDAASKAEWDAMARRLKPFMTVLGGDPASITAVRLTRLPGCHRGQAGPRAPKFAPSKRRWADEPLQFDAAGNPIWTPPADTEQAVRGPWTGGRLQELLYLNPEPDGRSIVDRPTCQKHHAMRLTPQSWVQSGPCRLKACDTADWKVCATMESRPTTEGVPMRLTAVTPRKREVHT